MTDHGTQPETIHATGHRPDRRAVLEQQRDTAIGEMRARERDVWRARLATVRAENAVRAAAGLGDPVATRTQADPAAVRHASDAVRCAGADQHEAETAYMAAKERVDSLAQEIALLNPDSPEGRLAHLQVAEKTAWTVSNTRYEQVQAAAADLDVARRWQDTARSLVENDPQPHLETLDNLCRSNAYVHRAERSLAAAEAAFDQAQGAALDLELQVEWMQRQQGLEDELECQ